MAPIDPPTQKLSISSLEGIAITVTAMYNPKEVQIDKSVPWTKQAQSKGDQPSLEFSSADGRVMSFELMFDGYEAGTNVHTAFIQNLVKLGTRAGRERLRGQEATAQGGRQVAGRQAAGLPGRD